MITQIIFTSGVLFLTWYRKKLASVVSSWPHFREHYKFLTGHGLYALKMLQSPTGWIEGAFDMANRYPD